MPLDPEFKKHLRSLTREVQESISDELEQHKRQLVYDAHQTHNGAAVPIAYKDAALYSTEQRVRRTIQKYIEAVEIWGISVDAAFEGDMLKEFWSLTSGPIHLQFPPMISRPTLPAVQQSYAQERGRLAKRLVNEGTNRMRELKMKMQRVNRAAQAPTTNISNTFNAPVGTANIGSTVHVTNNLTVTAQILDDMDRISEGNPQLQAVALEIRNSQNQGPSAIEKLQKWATLLNAVGGLAEKAHQYFPRIEVLLSQLKHIG
jgi:hypothetical protein